MNRLTKQQKWTDDIDLSQELGYKHIFQQLAEYENTGLTPAEVAELAQAKADGRIAVSPCSQDKIQHNFCRNCGSALFMGGGNLDECCLAEHKIAEAQAAIDRMEGQE